MTANYPDIFRKDAMLASLFCDALLCILLRRTETQALRLYGKYEIR